MTIRSRQDAEYLWADSHGGLGKVALARFRLGWDRADLAVARRHLVEAREVFALDPDNRFTRECDDLIAECDRLAAEIAAAGGEGGVAG